MYDGITYYNITFPDNKIKRIFEHYFLLGNMFISAMKDKFSCSNEDKILLYTSNLSFSEKLVKYAGKEKIGIACDIVEWHQPFQFEGADKSWIYRKTMYPMYHKFFYKVAPSTKNIIAISNCLKEHFVGEGCNTIVVPIYVDIDKRKKLVFSSDEEYVNLIYPGNPYKKDDLYEHVDFALLPRPINLTTQANFPSKVPEMMNKGIPVIMNRVGDISEYL